MSHSALDILDDDILGLFLEETRSKSRKKNRRKQNGIYDEIDSFDDISENTPCTQNSPFLKEEIPCDSNILDQLESTHLFNNDESFNTALCEVSPLTGNIGDAALSISTPASDTTEINLRTPRIGDSSPCVEDENERGDHSNTLDKDESNHDHVSSPELDEQSAEVKDVHPNHQELQQTIKSNNENGDGMGNDHYLIPQTKIEDDEVSSDRDSKTNGVNNPDHLTEPPGIRLDEDKPNAMETANGLPKFSIVMEKPPKPTGANVRRSRSTRNKSCSPIPPNLSKSPSSRSPQSTNSNEAPVVRRRLRITMTRPETARPRTGSTRRHSQSLDSSLSDSGSDGDTNASLLRQMAYKNWCAKHQRRPARDSASAGEQPQQDEELKKRQMSEMVFKSWREKKREFFLAELKKKREMDEERKRKESEAKEKRQSCEKAFQAWKAQKDVLIKQKNEEAIETRRQKEQAKKEAESSKRTAAKQAYTAWRTKKETELKERIQQKRKKEMEESKLLEEQARDKADKANEAYTQWELRKIATLENVMQSTDRSQSTERVPWRPPSARFSHIR